MDFQKDKKRAKGKTGRERSQVQVETVLTVEETETFRVSVTRISYYTQIIITSENKHLLRPSKP